MKKIKKCPLCGKKFKPMTEKQWRHNLKAHLTLSQKHKLSREEAEKIAEQQVF